MKSARPDTWMPIYWGDYLKDTMHLRAEGHGAYLLLMAAYWINGEPLPDDDEHLMAVARLDPNRWRRLKPVLARFFRVERGLWRHKRIDEELERAKNITNAKQEAGRLGGKAKATGKQNDSGATPVLEANGLANGKQTGTPSQSPSPSPEEPPPPQSPPQPPSRGSPGDERRRPKAKTADLWDAYNEAYERRYGVAPLRNGKVNGQLARFIDRVGASEAPFIAAYFVTSNNGWYVKRGHSVDDLLKDAEKLRTEWVTRTQITDRKARELDRKSQDAAEWARLIAEAEHAGKLTN